MAHVAVGKNKRTRKRSRDAFAEDEIHEGDYESPGPRIDPDAAAIAAMLSEIKKRSCSTGHVMQWSPRWLKRANASAHEAAVMSLAMANKERAEATTDEGVKAIMKIHSFTNEAEARQYLVSQSAMRVGMATETMRTTQLALQQSPDAGAFSLYFFEDKLAVDSFDRDQSKDAEMGAEGLGLTPLQQIEANLKTKLCGERGIKYIALGPDDDLDKVQLAAKLNMLTARRGAHQRTAKSRNGITGELE